MSNHDDEDPVRKYAQEKFDEVLSLRKRSKARRNAQKQLVTGTVMNLEEYMAKLKAEAAAAFEAEYGHLRLRTEEDFKSFAAEHLATGDAALLDKPCDWTVRISAPSADVLGREPTAVYSAALENSTAIGVSGNFRFECVTDADGKLLDIINNCD